MFVGERGVGKGYENVQLYLAFSMKCSCIMNHGNRKSANVHCYLYPLGLNMNSSKGYLAGMKLGRVFLRLRLC